MRRRGEEGCTAGAGTNAPGSDGFIKRWLLLEPIAAERSDREPRPGGLKKESFPASSVSFPTTATR
jgi:hypothetical protein